MMADLQGELQRLTGTTLDAQGAANVWAGRARSDGWLDLLGALNEKNGTVGLGMNAVVRALVGADEGDAQGLLADAVNVVDLPGTSGNFISTPDSAALSIVGDIDIRCKVAPDDWTPGVQGRLVNKRSGSAGGESFSLSLNTNGRFLWEWSADGSAVLSSSSTTDTGFADGAVKWVRVTLDVDNGATGNDTTFYTSDDGSTWTQLGTVVTKAGVTSIFDSATEVRIGAFGTGIQPVSGNVYQAEIRNGIGGTVVASPDFTAQAVTGERSPSSFTDDQGDTWTINGSDWEWGVSSA